MKWAQKFGHKLQFEMSQKRKYCLKERLLAVRSVIGDNLSFRQAGGLIGADHREVRWRVAHHRLYGKKHYLLALGPITTPYLNCRL